MFLCVKSLESRLACSKSLINVSCVAGGGEHTALGGASNHGGHRGAVCSVSWVGSWSVPLLPFPGGDQPCPAFLRKDTWPCVSRAPLSQGSGTWRRRKEREGSWLTLGILGSYTPKTGPLPGPESLMCSSQSRVLTGLTLSAWPCAVWEGTPASQPAEVCLRFEREESLARRR